MYRIWQNDDYNNLNRLHGGIYKQRKYLSKSIGMELLNVRGIGYKLATTQSEYNFTYDSLILNIWPNKLSMDKQMVKHFGVDLIG